MLAGILELLYQDWSFHFIDEEVRVTREGWPDPASYICVTKSGLGLFKLKSYSASGRLLDLCFSLS